MDRLRRLQQRLAPALRPLGGLYALAMHARAELYARGGSHGLTPALPTISVGNISLGGSGKTPLVDWLLGWARNEGLRTVVLTRGYKARPPHRPYLVAADSPPALAGDEPLLLARRHPEAAIVVDPVRQRAAAWAMARLRPDLLLLDDGFQHLPLGRHADLVLLTPADLEADFGRVFPAGTWREGPAALARATAFLVKAPAEEFAALAPRIQERLGPLGRPVFGFDLRPAGLRHLTTGQWQPDLAGAPYLLACGVARPEAVVRTATAALGQPPRRVLPYADHRAYTAADVAAIQRTSQAAGAQAVVVTAKDAVKLAPLAPQGFWSLETDLEFHLPRDGAPFAAWWPTCFTTIRNLRE